MRAGLVISVLVVLGLAYGLVLAYQHGVRRTRAYVQEKMVGMGVPATETARASSSFDLGGATALTIENDFGSVEVKPGGPQVRVERVVYAGGQDDAARARAAKFTVSGARGPEGGYTIKVSGSQERPRVRVDLIAQAPPGLALQLKLQAGNGEVADHTGPVSISCESGNVAVSLAGRFSGRLRAETQSGNIGLKLPADANCRIEATAGSGGVSSSLPLRDLSSAHGHLTGRLGAGLGQIELRTGSGNITLEPASSG